VEGTGIPEFGHDQDGAVSKATALDGVRIRVAKRRRGILSLQPLFEPQGYNTNLVVDCHPPQPPPNTPPNHFLSSPVVANPQHQVQVSTTLTLCAGRKRPTRFSMRSIPAGVDEACRAVAATPSDRCRYHTCRTACRCRFRRRRYRRRRPGQRIVAGFNEHVSVPPKGETDYRCLAPPGQRFVSVVTDEMSAPESASSIAPRYRQSSQTDAVGPPPQKAEALEALPRFADPLVMVIAVVAVAQGGRERRRNCDSTPPPPRANGDSAGLMPAPISIRRCQTTS